MTNQDELYRMFRTAVCETISRVGYTYLRQAEFFGTNERRPVEKLAA